MMRRSALIWFVVIAAVASGLFLVKHRVQTLEGDLSAVQRQIAENRAAIHVLEGEWSHLNRPSRLEDLGRRLLDLVPVEPVQIVTIEGLTDRLADIAADTAVSTTPTVPAAPTDRRDAGWVRALLSKLEQQR